MLGNGAMRVGRWAIHVRIRTVGPVRNRPLPGDSPETAGAGPPGEGERAFSSRTRRARRARKGLRAPGRASPAGAGWAASSQRWRRTAARAAPAPQ